MLIEWKYNTHALSLELYVDGKMYDRLWKSEDTEGVYWFRGGFIWTNLEAAKKDMEAWYAE